MRTGGATLVPVAVGLVDAAAGLVEVSSDGLAIGQRIAVLVGRQGVEP